MNGWSHLLLDGQDRPLGDLDGVTGGSAEIVAQSALGGSATLSLDHTREIDWMAHRVQVWFSSGTRSWPVGTYLLSSPQEQHSDLGLRYEVGLLTKMNVIAEDTVEDRYSVGAGVAVIPTVVGLIQSTGETRIAATDTGVMTTGGLTWEAGTPKLRIINDLLQAAGYWSLWCDGSGLFRVEPYVNPELRPVSFAFEHGERSLHLPDWGREQDHTSVPNRIVLRTEGDEVADGLVGVATNEDPDSPYSFQSRGNRWIGPEAEVVEASSQAVIEQLAAKKLRDLMSPVARMTVGHAMLDLNPNDLVSFTPADGRRRLATVQRMSMGFTFDTDISAEWREVL